MAAGWLALSELALRPPAALPPPLPQSTRAFGSLSWSYDYQVDVVIRNNRPVVRLNGRIISQGPKVAVGPTAACHYHPDRCSNGRCVARRVDITRPGIAIAITQPWIAGWHKGSYANWLEV